MPDAKQTEVYQKVQAAYAAFEAKMNELDKKRFDWMKQVLSRIEKEKIEAIHASLMK